jgi:hypothetical protein
MHKGHNILQVKIANFSIWLCEMSDSARLISLQFQITIYHFRKSTYIVVLDKIWL